MILVSEKDMLILVLLEFSSQTNDEMRKGNMKKGLDEHVICPQEVGRINKKIIGKEFGIAPDSFLLVSV